MRTSIFPGWWQVAVAMIAQASSSGAVFTAFSVIAVPLQGAFQSSRTLLMSAVTMTFLVIGVVNPFLGAAMDRYSLRTLMLIGAAFLVLGFFSLSFTASMIQVVVVYAVFMAIPNVLLGPLAASTLLSRWFSRCRGLVMGLAASGTAIGGLLLPPLLQWLFNAFEWRTALRLFSAILLLIVVPVVTLLTINRPADRNLYPDGDAHPPADAAVNHFAQFSSTAGVLRDRNFWFIAVVVGLVFAGATGLSTSLLPLILDKGISADKGALLLSIFAVGNFAGKMLFAAVGDRVKLRLALATAILLQAFSVFGFLRADTYPLLVVASLLLGLGLGGLLPLWTFLLSRAFGALSIGRVMGLMSVVLTVFNLASPMLFGLAFDKAGNYSPALIGHIVALCIAMLLLPQIRTQPTAATVKSHS
jgi:predicted MFS family arabinose efflux permease